MILFDTSVLIDYDDLDLPDEPYVSSVVVLAELEFGIAAAKTADLYNERRTRLARLRASGFQWHPYLESTATYHAELMSLVHPHAPSHTRSRDLMIAATAFELGAKLATLNPGDFRYVASRVEILVPTPR
ncbi:PIN domain-containing protein [Frondihabitans australicus]|uniref:PIN domain-containing protein n=1 Tax=Frondihabitans australicus TaxID=386892 RepID=A0A495IGW2_9MICO|nr:PIN domain-containing protein [Frondihabitans australicus]RKR75227.1 hypothetical protein C8E83_2365 [Frondihabitans australicus]